MALILGFQAIYIVNPISTLFHPQKVMQKTFEMSKKAAKADATKSKYRKDKDSKVYFQLYFEVLWA